MLREHARRAAASGQSRTVWSQDAEASVVPSGEAASATIGAVWPSSTASGSALPELQIAIRPSAPAVAARPSFSHATALTASEWKRSTCSAALCASDQRMAVESKLPEIAFSPSGEIASARTGPPWPRSCAKADVAPIDRTASASSADRTPLASNAFAAIIRMRIGLSACPVCRGRGPWPGGRRDIPGSAARRSIRDRAETPKSRCRLSACRQTPV